MTDFTPGPWHTEREADGARTIVEDAQDNEIAIVSWVYLTAATAQEAANARLIAAAPDLLAALQLVNRLHSHHWPSDVTDVVDDALLKAVGE